MRWAPRYRARWALDPAAERRAFECWVDDLMARWEAHPDLHVYHFAAYEPGALKRLMGRFATREEVARACIFLLSDQASYVTGECLTIDGGAWLGRGLTGEQGGAIPVVRRRRGGAIEEEPGD